MSKLDLLRSEIDETDKVLAQAFERRMEVSREIARYKKKMGIDILDPNREREALQMRSGLISDESLKTTLEAFFRALMQWSRDEQARIIGAAKPSPKPAPKSPIIAIQGAMGANSDQAARECFPESEIITFSRFRDVFEAIISGNADVGVLPLENSSTGSINEVYDLLGQYGCFIVGEKTIGINHCLLGIEGAKISDIEEVYSHEQGFSQCSSYLERKEGWRLVPYINTATSAKFVKECGDVKKAAIASRYAALLYGLSIIAPDIQDNMDNQTRFILVGARLREDEKCNKASVMLRLKHERGSLLRALGHIFILGLNMTKIESRPIPGCAWEYSFYVDIEGNVSQKVLQGLSELMNKDGSACRLIGRYESDGKAV